MYSGKTIDSRSGLPKDIDYELLRFQTHTGRAFLLSDRGFEKKYGYRHGVETPVGDIEENLWCALMKELVEKNNDILYVTISLISILYPDYLLNALSLILTLIYQETLTLLSLLLFSAVSLCSVIIKSRITTHQRLAA